MARIEKGFKGASLAGTAVPKVSGGAGVFDATLDDNFGSDVVRIRGADNASAGVDLAAPSSLTIDSYAGADGNGTWYPSIRLGQDGNENNEIQLNTDGTGSVTTDGVFFPKQAATASAPSYVKGAIYFDTTLNKLRVGGASGWETVTSN